MYDANGNRLPFPFKKIDEELPFPWERNGAQKFPR